MRRSPRMPPYNAAPAAKSATQKARIRQAAPNVSTAALLVRDHDVLGILRSRITELGRTLRDQAVLLTDERARVGQPPGDDDLPARPERVGHSAGVAHPTRRLGR